MLAALLLPAALACAVDSVPVPRAPLSREPRYNEVFRVATHNSYWVKRSPVIEPYAGGAQERLLDQLLFDHARALEIDVHKDDAHRGQWLVYHTDRQTNVFCSPFVECLKQLRQFQYALPRHEALTVVIELKELLGHNWDAAHTPADFDALLEQYLGPYLYRPRELLARCKPGSTLRACVKERGWPTVDELRGKFLFTVLGNWRWGAIGHGRADWAAYPTWGGEGPEGAAARSAWAMATDFDGEHVPPKRLAAAYEASVFLQVERVKEADHMKEVRRFIADGGVVRAGDSFSLDQQRAAFGWAQMAQTDFPWLQYDDRGPLQPLRPLPAAAGKDSALREPGERLALARRGAQDAPRDRYAFAYAEPVDSVSDWETLPSTTRPSPNPEYPNPRWTRGKGCLRAEGPGGSFSVCRQTSAAGRGAPPAESAVVTVESRAPFKTYDRPFVSGMHAANGVGDQLRLLVRRTPRGDCAFAFSASEVDQDGRPRWTPLAGECFAGRLTRQGVAAQWGDVLFVNTRRNGRAVEASALRRPAGGDYTLTPGSFPEAHDQAGPLARLP